MRFTAADPWVTYFPLLRRVKCVLAYCFLFSLFFFLCCYLNAWTSIDALPMS